MGFSCWIFSCKSGDFSCVLEVIEEHNKRDKNGRIPRHLGEKVTVDEILKVGDSYFLLCHNLGGRDATNEFFMKRGLGDRYKVHIPFETKPDWYGHPEMTETVWENKTGDSKVFPE